MTPQLQKNWLSSKKRQNLYELTALTWWEQLWDLWLWRAFYQGPCASVSGSTQDRSRCKLPEVPWGDESNQTWGSIKPLKHANSKILKIQSWILPSSEDKRLYFHIGLFQALLTLLWIILWQVILKKEKKTTSGTINRIFFIYIYLSFVCSVVCKSCLKCW